MEADVQPPQRELPAGRMLFVGRLVDLKGAHYLLRALAVAREKLGKELTLTIAGSGPEEMSLRTLAGRLNLSVRFAGWLDVQDRLKEMRLADLLIVPSLWPEPFALVGIEAGCVGLPAVGYANGGIPDWLAPGESGELASANPPRVEGLAAAMVRALADPEHYRRLCQGAWNRARRLTAASHLDRLLPILEKAALEGGRVGQCVK